MATKPQPSNTHMTPQQMTQAMGSTHAPKTGMTNSTMHGSGMTKGG